MWRFISILKDEIRVATGRKEHIYVVHEVVEVWKRNETKKESRYYEPFTKTALCKAKRCPRLLDEGTVLIGNLEQATV